MMHPAVWESVGSYPSLISLSLDNAPKAVQGERNAVTTINARSALMNRTTTASTGTLKSAVRPITTVFSKRAPATSLKNQATPRCTACCHTPCPVHCPKAIYRREACYL